MERPIGASDSVAQPGVRTRQLATAALLAALLSVSAWIALPLGQVPVTLQVFVVVLAALLLTPGWSAAAVGSYLLLGAAGVPVFAGAQGGLGVVLGPTGGYLWGFLVGAVTASAVRMALRRAFPGARAVIADAVAAAFCIAIVYAAGWLQLSLVTGMGLAPAFAAGVVPFVLPDAAKAVAAVIVAGAVRRVVPEAA